MVRKQKEKPREQSGSKGDAVMFEERPVTADSKSKSKLKEKKPFVPISVGLP